MECETDSTAVLVIDCQNDFCHPDGALYAEASEDVIENVNEVLRTSHRSGAKILLTQDTHEDGHPEFEQWGEHCLQGTWGHAIHPDIDLEPSVYPVIQKDTYDAFHETKLHQLLTDEGIETLIICGTLANVCVQETASSAALHGYDVKVVSDAVGYINEEQKQAALDHIDFLIGETVTTDEL